MINKLHPLLAGASIVILVAGMHFTASIINPILLALLFSISLSPLLSWLLRKGWPRSLALTVTILSVIVGSFLLIGGVGAAATQVAAQLPSYEEKLTSIINSTLSFFEARGFILSDLKSIEALSPEKLVQFAISFLGGIVSTFSNLFLVVLLVLFMLIDIGDWGFKVDQGQFSSGSWPARLGETSKDIRKYISITAFTGLLTSLANVILLIILGVDFPLLWGFLSFLFNFIPNIGMILSILPPAALALLEFGTLKAALVVGGFFLINFIVENIVKPKFIGKELSLSLSLIFISVVFWSWVLGMIGAILAVPLTIIVQNLLRAMSGNEPLPAVESQPDENIV
jgi:AI-2 transport protein TqsA